VSRPPLARERVLDAVERVLIDEGPTALTLERVAERAGVSKGGLLYHFPAKANLVDGLFDRLGSLVESAVAHAPSEPDEVVRWFVHTSAWPTEQETSLYRALTAVLRSGDELETGRLRQIFDDYAEPLRRALPDPVLFESVRLVGDGLFLRRLVGLGPPESEVLDQLADELAARAV